MKLTGRQKAFLSQFLDLYREARDALHYTDVAQRLGVSKIAAYDMLRLLEKRGLLESRYVLRGKGRGAGRSSIVFRPTSLAHARFAELAGEAGNLEDWGKVRARILKALETRQDSRELLEEVLARLPSRRSPLAYAAEMVTAVILSLRQLQEGRSVSAPLEELRSLGLPDNAGLSAIGGLALGLSFVEQLNQRLVSRLVKHVGRYQEIIASLSAENKRLLADFVRDVMQIVGA